VVQEIHDTYFLVNIVDNDYVNEGSDLFTIFKEIITRSMTGKGTRRLCCWMMGSRGSCRSSHVYQSGIWPLRLRDMPL
jgi:hypothetical protein